MLESKKKQEVFYVNGTFVINKNAFLRLLLVNNQALFKIFESGKYIKDGILDLTINCNFNTTFTILG